MTLRNLIAKIANNCGLIAGERLAEIVVEVEAAMEELAARLNWDALLVSDHTIPLVSGADSYALPSDFHQLGEFNVRYVNGNETYTLGRGKLMGSVTTASRPMQFYTIGKTLRVNKSTASTGSFVLDYYKIPNLQGLQESDSFPYYDMEGFVIASVSYKMLLPTMSDKATPFRKLAESEERTFVHKFSNIQ